MSADPQQAHARLAQAAMVIGFNEMARQASTLGDRAYFRLAAAEAHEQFVARGGDPFLKSPHDVVTTIDVKPVRLIFRESDIEQMRQAVTEWDARKDRESGEAPGGRVVSTRPATRERPIIFTGESVRAILAGRKTVTRRVVKGQGPSAAEMQRRAGVTHSYWRERHEGPFEIVGPVGVARELGATDTIRCPYGEPGDHLWVKETWRRDGGGVEYRATKDGPSWAPKWKSPLFMSRTASRLSLEVVSVRVERLHDITEEDVFAEGVDMNEAGSFYVDDGTGALVEFGDPRRAFAFGWDVINDRRKGCSWDDNPLVWRVEFRRVEA